MVVEELEIDIEPEHEAGFLARDHEIWTTFLRGCPGFIRKEVWRPADRPGVLLLQIWWATRDDWKAISDEVVAEVDARMGEWFRAPRGREHQVVRATPFGSGDGRPGLKR